MAQTTVNMKQAFGVQGEFYDSSVKRVTPHTLGGAAVIGRAAWVDGSGKAYGAPTGGATLRGIFVSPKEYINRSADFAATLALNAGEVAQVADLGHVNVVTKTDAVEGATAWVVSAVNSSATGYTGDWATGDIAASTGSTISATGVTFISLPYARFVRATGAAGSIAVLELNG